MLFLVGLAVLQPDRIDQIRIRQQVPVRQRRSDQLDDPTGQSQGCGSTRAARTRCDQRDGLLPPHRRGQPHRVAAGGLSTWSGVLSTRAHRIERDNRRAVGAFRIALLATAALLYCAVLVDYVSANG